MIDSRVFVHQLLLFFSSVSPSQKHSNKRSRYCVRDLRGARLSISFSRSRWNSALLKFNFNKSSRALRCFLILQAKKQDEKAVTALDGINLRAKNAWRLCCTLIYCPWFLLLSSVLMSLNAVFFLAFLREMSLLKREKKFQTCWRNFTIPWTEPTT